MLVCYTRTCAVVDDGITLLFLQEVRTEDVAKAVWINAEFNRNKAGEEILEWDDFQRLWAIEKYEYACTCVRAGVGLLLTLWHRYDQKHDAAMGSTL